MKTRVLLATALTMLAAPALAMPVTYFAFLSGNQEAPTPVVTSGTGYGSATLDGDTLTVNLSFSGLGANTIFAHIHCCSDSGANGPVALDFGTAFPIGVTAGSYTGLFNLADLSTYGSGFVSANGGTLASVQAAFVNGFLGGRSYFNIHTTAFRGGEIRGQIPEPASMTLLGLGLLGLGLRRRK